MTDEVLTEYISGTGIKHFDTTKAGRWCFFKGLEIINAGDDRQACIFLNCFSITKGSYLNMSSVKKWQSSFMKRYYQGGKYPSHDTIKEWAEAKQHFDNGDYKIAEDEWAEIQKHLHDEAVAEAEADKAAQESANQDNVADIYKDGNLSINYFELTDIDLSYFADDENPLFIYRQEYYIGQPRFVMTLKSPPSCMSDDKGYYYIAAYEIEASVYIGNKTTDQCIIELFNVWRQNEIDSRKACAARANDMIWHKNETDRRIAKIRAENYIKDGQIHKLKEEVKALKKLLKSSGNLLDEEA